MHDDNLSDEDELAPTAVRRENLLSSSLAMLVLISLGLKVAAFVVLLRATARRLMSFV